MAMHVGGSRGGPVSEINVTPLVDFMLALHDAHVDNVGLSTRTPPAAGGTTPGEL